MVASIKFFFLKFLHFFSLLHFFLQLVTGFGGKKWSLFLLVSHFWKKSGKKVVTAPTNLRFQHFPTRISKLFLKKFKIFSWKEILKIKIPRVFSKKIQEFSWKDVRKEDII